jgi:hypothetical protein
MANGPWLRLRLDDTSAASGHGCASVHSPLNRPRLPSASPFSTKCPAPHAQRTRHAALPLVVTKQEGILHVLDNITDFGRFVALKTGSTILLQEQAVEVYIWRTNSNGTACTAQAELLGQISQHQTRLAGPSAARAVKWGGPTRTGR